MYVSGLKMGLSGDDMAEMDYNTLLHLLMEWGDMQRDDGDGTEEASQSDIDWLLS